MFYSDYWKRYNPEQAFESYPSIRIEKAHHVVNTSWKIGKISQLENQAPDGNKKSNAAQNT